MISRSPEQDMNEVLSFEAALPYLTNPNPSMVDSENLIAYLSEIKRPTLQQARTIFGAAAQRVALWVKAADSDTVLDMLGPSLNTLRESVETSAGQETTAAFTSDTTQIIAGIVSADFEVYPRRLRTMISGNQFGEKGSVLVGTLSRMLPDYKKKTELPLDEDDEQEVIQVATIIDDLIQTDPTLARSLQAELPTYLLFASQDLPTTFPRVHQMLSEGLGSQQIHKALSEAYLRAASESEREQLKERVKGREFGDPIDVFSNVCALATNEEEDLSDDGLAEDVWIELLELNRVDPRLRPLREKLMPKEWYWDPESILLTLMDTVNCFGFEDETQISPFIERHQGSIVEALKRNVGTSDWRRYGVGVEATVSRGELTGRLAAMLEEIKDIVEENPKFVMQFSDRLLLASLHTPSQEVKPQRPSGKRAFR